MESLPKVDFYHLADEQAHPMRLFCCRLADKAWRMGNRIFIHCDDSKQVAMLDDLMWSYRDDGFLPHATLKSPTDTADTPILLGESIPAEQPFDLLINLASSLPTELDRISARIGRIAEIINQNPNVKQQGRIRYSYYDKNKYPLEYHEITAG